MDSKVVPLVEAETGDAVSLENSERRLVVGWPVPGQRGSGGERATMSREVSDQVFPPAQKWWVIGRHDNGIVRGGRELELRVGRHEEIRARIRAAWKLLEEQGEVVSVRR